MNVVRGNKQQRDRKHENIHGQHETNTAFNLQTLHMHRNPAVNKHAELQRKEKGMGLICLSWFKLDLRELSGVFLVVICFFEEIQHYRKSKVVSPSEYQTLPL